MYYYLLGFLLYPVFFSNDKNSFTKSTENILIGIITNILFLYIWNLFFPINYIGFIFFISICLLIGTKYNFFKRIKNLSLKSNLKFLIFISFFSLWLGFLSNNSAASYDLGLYHYQVIKWAENFQIVKGIGNLHPRLGFSCSSWLLTSQFNTVFGTKLFLWTHGAIYLLIGFINFLYIPLFSNNQNRKLEMIIRILYLPILIHYCFSVFPGTSSDLPILLYTLILSIYYFRFFYYDIKENIDIIFIVSVLGVSSKLTFGITILGLAIPLTIIIIKKIPRFIFFFRGPILLASITFFLWSYRNVIMTGYPFFPFSKISVPVEWKVDESRVDHHKNHIVYYAKGYTNKLGYDAKLNWYLSRLTPQYRRIELLYPIIIGILGFTYSIYKKKNISQIILLVFPSIISILFWVQIPANRFFSSSFWWFGSMLSIFLIHDIIKRFNQNYFYVIIIISSIAIHVIDRIGSPKDFFPIKIRQELPKANIQKLTNSHGFNYYFPLDGDQCWDSPLPCSPENKFFLEDIILINENNLSDGFKVREDL